MCVNTACWQKSSFHLSFDKTCQWPSTSCLCCCLTELWIKPMIPKSRYLKIWAWDNHHAFHKRKTFHSGLSCYGRTSHRNSGPHKRKALLLQGALLSLAASNRHTKQGIQLKQARGRSLLTPLDQNNRCIAPLCCREDGSVTPEQCYLCDRAHKASLTPQQ